MAGKEKPPAKDAVTPEGERIAKVLSRAGIASRREAERLIELGEVKVNGKTITSPALNVTSKDKITVRGEPVGQPEPPRLWLYYKPEGLVTSAADEKGRDTVFDHLPEDMPRVMSVGRLDLNSEGLLLLTNDGELKRRLELPSTGWLRKYRVRVKGNPTDPDLEPLRKGVTVDGEKFQPMDVKLDRHQGANAWLTVGLREGKNREIRRAMTHIGLTVNRLIRISYGPFRLNELQPGEVEEVKPRILRDQLGLAEGGGDDKPKRSIPKPQPKSASGTPAKAGIEPKSSKKPLKAGEGLRQLSDAWQKATRPAPGKSATSRTRPAGTAPRTGPRPGGARKP
ncbi:MAG: rRNA pseudouridine synthase [Tabrizicola sp.]|jgi:23S rRNA pseudouridine2605 synthase|nr:rRNA pseudouridine synthase [Tabrizicola sp.]